MRYLVPFAFLLVVSTSIDARPLVLFRDATNAPGVASIPPGAGLVTVDRDRFASIDIASLHDVTIPSFHIPGMGRRELVLERFDLLAPTAVVVEGRASGDRAFAAERHMMLHGSVEGILGSHVYLAVFAGYAMGYIEIPRDGSSYATRILVAPDDASSPNPVTIVFVAPDDRPADTDRFRDHGFCGVEDLARYLAPGAAEFLAREASRKDVRNLSEVQTLVVQIALECDSLYYEVHGRNLSRAANYAIAIMGASSAIYQRDLSLLIQVPYLRIWTTSDNPFPGPDDGDLLNQLRTHWSTNMGWVKRSGVMIFSKFRGGLAYVGALCGDYGYAIAGPGGSTNYPATGYVWDIDVVSHELGHNLGSPHTHSCYWSPAIDSCWDAEGSCFSARNPRPGWIMSYCHLNAGTRLFFHPRVATLIRAWAERAACITPAPHPTSIDVASVDIVTPANGGTLVKGAPFVPRAVIRNVGSTTARGAQGVFTITTSDSVTAYTQALQAPTLAPGQSVTLSFPAATLERVGLYEASNSVYLPADSFLYNNRLSRPFTIVETDSARGVTLTYPNGGESLRAGDSATIAWTDSGVTEISIALSTDSGATWNTVRWLTSADSGSFRWRVPPYPTTTALIRISDRAHASVTDRSDAPFSIVVDRDVQPVEFVVPAGNDSIGAPVAPRVLVRNNGAQPATNVPVRLQLEWRPGALSVYDTTIIVPTLPPTSTLDVTFPTTGELPDGPFLMIAKTSFPGDRDTSNDSLGRSSTNTHGIAPPSMVWAEGICGAIVITWSPSISMGVESYVILRGATQNTMTPFDTVRPTLAAWVDESVGNGQLYHYALQSTRGESQSTRSRIATAQGMCFPAGDTMTPPRIVLPLFDARDVQLPVALTWERLAHAERYHVQLASDSACTDVIAAWFVRDPHPIVAGSVTFEGSYFWRVRGVNNSLIGPWTSVHPFTTGTSCAEGALRFSGIDGVVLDTGFTWSGGPVTVEFWNYVRSTELTTGSAFSVGATDVLNNRFQAHVPWIDGTLYWDCGDVSNGSGRLSVDYSPYIDRWTHVALVFDGAGERSIYLNGRVVARGRGDSSGPRDLSWLRLGSTGPGTNHRHKGVIDEFRVWRTARSATELRDHMTTRVEASSQDDLRVCYRMDEGSGTVTNDLVEGNGVLLGQVEWVTSDAPINCDAPPPLDSPTLVAPRSDTLLSVSSTTAFDWTDVDRASGYEVDIAANELFGVQVVHIDAVKDSRLVWGALAPGRTWYWRARAIASGVESPWSSTGRFSTAPACGGRAYMLDSLSKSITIPSFSWTGREVTIEYWAYVDSSDVRKSWMFYVGTADSSYRLSAHAPWSDRMVHFDFGNYQKLGRISAGYTENLNRWTHVALVSNGRDFKGIYLDGELVASDSIADRAEILPAGLRIGAGPGGTPVKATITEFRIWNTARDRDRIRENMYRRFSTPQSGLVGYWRLNDGDTVARDASGFDHDGLIQDTSQWTAGDVPVEPLIPAIDGPRRARKNAVSTYQLTHPITAIRWSVDNGSITTGQGTSVITVLWSEQETGRVVVTGTTLDGCPVATVIDVLLRATLGENDPVEATVARARIEPNPTRGSASLLLDLSRHSTVRIDVFDALGQHVALAGDRALDAGTHVVPLPIAGLASGLGYCVIRIDQTTITLPLTIVR